MAGGPTRADTYDVTVKIANIDFGTFDQMEGGEVDSDQITYKAGAMSEPESLGGTRNVTNVIVRRLYRLARDHANSGRFINWAGKADMIVKKQPLDVDGNVYGSPIVFRGTLKRVKFPDHNSTSNDAGLVELEMTVDGIPTGMAFPG